MNSKIVTMFAILLSATFLIASAVVGQQGQVPPQPPNAQTPLPGVPPDQPVPNLPNVQNVPKNPPHPPMPDPLADVMFPPDMIMGHARQLNLTDEQKLYMRGEIQKTTTSFHELQWKLQDQMELLHDIMKSPSVSEEQALGQLNKVLDIEREIKRLHFGMAVRLKNRLTPEQQDQLHKMRMGQHMRMQPTPARPIHPIQ